MAEGNDDLIPEMQLEGGFSTTRLYAIGVVLAAIYAVSALIPLTPFLGGAGPLAQLTLTICIAPVFGILLGPSVGFAFGLIAGVIAAFLPGVSLIVPTVILGPAISGLLTGLCLKPRTEVRGYKVPGPLLTALYLGVIIILYLIPNYSAWWFMIYYVLAMAVALSLQLQSMQFDTSVKGTSRFLQLFPLTLIGTVTDFSMMTMGAVYLLQIPAEAFGFGIFPFMLAERCVATLLSAIIVAIVLKAFPNIDWALRTK
ncbi:MAG: hypothetical protein EAX95_14300 [Candidatus Thorarchaeota archaeon]|nr:hypothetical protein [Candidatus Thorarchaeota archaeon]